MTDGLKILNYGDSEFNSTLNFQLLTHHSEVPALAGFEGCAALLVAHASRPSFAKATAGTSA